MTPARSIFARTSLFAIAAAGLCHAQKFDVASIRPHTDPGGLKYQIDEHRIDFGGMDLKSLVSIAYRIQGWQLTIPDWAGSARFDIQATFPPGATRSQVPELLQALLADRFGLVVHHEMQEHRVFALLQSKTGAKLADAAIDNSDRTFLSGRAVLYKMDTVEGDGFYSISVKDGRSTFDAQRITMAELAAMLTGRRYFDDPVVDMTGLKGYWQLRFDMPKNNGQARAMLAAQGTPLPPADPDGISLPGELRKLGLDIDHRKAPIDTLIVDHIEKQPTEN